MKLIKVLLILLFTIPLHAETLHIYDLHLSKDIKTIKVADSVPVDFTLDDIQCWVGKYVNVVVSCNFNGIDVSAELTCSEELEDQTAFEFNFNRIYCTEDK